jgi:hypothetical protein
MTFFSTLLAAAEAAGPEKSKLPFFLAGGVLAVFAVLISVIGFKKPDFPADEGAARGVMGLSIVLVLATMSAIVYISN